MVIHSRRFGPSDIPKRKIFTLKIIVQGNDEIDYSYNITVATKPYVRLIEESIVRLTLDVSGVGDQQKTQLLPIDQALELFHVGYSSPNSNLEITKIFGTESKPIAVESSLAQMGWLFSMIQHRLFEVGELDSSDAFEVLEEAVVAI